MREEEIHISTQAANLTGNPTHVRKFHLASYRKECVFESLVGTVDFNFSE